MEHFAEYKIPGGKLLSVKIEYGGRIEKIRIFGDFFLYPEETVHEIEELLIGTDIDASEEEMSEKINKMVVKKKAEMLGITPQAIAHTIRMAIER